MGGTDRDSVLWRASTDLARARGEADAAAALARAVGMILGASAARVWMIDRARGYRLAASWPEEGPPANAESPRDLPRALVMGIGVESGAPVGSRSCLVLPLLDEGRPVGGIEVLEAGRQAGPLAASDARELAGLLQTASASLLAAKKTAALEQSHLETVERLTRLFDVGRTLGATLDRDRLISLCVNRVLRALEVDAVYLWLPSDVENGLQLAAADGTTADRVAGWLLAPGEGLAGAAAAARSTQRAAVPEEIPDFNARRDVGDGRAPAMAVAAPMGDGEETPLEGVLEIVRFEEGVAIDGAEVLFLEEIAHTAAHAFANARRLEAERRAADLSSLLSVAQEISSSLDPAEVAYTLVHKAALVIPFRTAALGLVKSGRFELEAVSGHDFVDPALPTMRALRDVLAWATDLDEGFLVVREADGSVDAERAETREKFAAYFAVTETNTFLAIPLRDEEGKLGVFALEAQNPYAFSARDIEAATLLSTQATVALRNALLYRQVPVSRFLQPFAERKRLFDRLPWPRRVGLIAGVLAAALALAVPLPLRVGGETRVLPIRRVPTTAEIDGRIARVFVREGDSVRMGQGVAELDDGETRSGREDARARLEAAEREQARLRAEGDAGGAAVEAARIEGLRAELALWDRRMQRTTLRAASGGVVSTPRIEETVGARLNRGEVFCEVVDPGTQALEIAIDERDAGLVRPGMRVKVKLNAFPDRSFSARVDRVGVSAQLQGLERVVLVRSLLDGTAPPLISGMSGRAKISTGATPLARIVFRKPARWIWSVIWRWLP